MKMIGRTNWPFCGPRCCHNYPYGSGKAHKRIDKKVAKAKEKNQWRKEYMDNR